MFSAVSAAVIGGTALTGGRGTIIGAFIGACVLGVLEDGFSLIGVSANTFTLMLGLVILAAMALNSRLGVLASSTRGTMGSSPGGDSGITIHEGHAGITEEGK